MKDELLIIADAGGTKTQWFCCLLNNREERILLTTEGINASINTDEHISGVISDLYNKIYNKFPSAKSCRLFFYGAGCNSQSLKIKLEELFIQQFPIHLSNSLFTNDIEGAARSLFGNEKGIVCILGTGSASGVYNGDTIIDSIPSLGFILGDEGSGAFMGKSLLNLLFKRKLSEKVKVKLEEFSNVRLTDVIERTYRQPGANRYLASFIPFIKENENEEEISELIDDSLKLFFINNVLKYNDKPNNRLRFAGSVAYIFRKRIEDISNSFGLQADRFLQNPIIGLGEYYLGTIK